MNGPAHPNSLLLIPFLPGFSAGASPTRARGVGKGGQLTVYIGLPSLGLPLRVTGERGKDLTKSAP